MVAPPLRGLPLFRAIDDPAVLADRVPAGREASPGAGAVDCHSVKASMAAKRGFERSFGWLTRYRRLLRDNERRLDVSEAVMYLAIGNLPVRRINYP
jgi:hypothetical protein